MGTFSFKLPDVGEGIAEAEIVAWHVDVGETIAEDQPLVDVMTDKATVEIGAPVSGKVVSRQGEIGDTAAVGSELVVIATGDQPEAPAPDTAPEEQEPAPPSRRPKTAPAAKAPAEAPAAKVPAEAPAEAKSRAPAPRRPPAKDKPKAAPAVRARAAALGIDLASVEGSGDGGRVLHEDIDRLLVAGRGSAPRPAPGAPREGIEEVKVVGLRRQIAQAMLDAKRRIPHFSYVEEVDVTALEMLRAGLAADETTGRPKVTLLPFLIRALVNVVPEHPGINAHFDDEAGVIRRHAAVHLGVATQTRRGLLVPVVRHAETLDVFALATEVARLSEAARAGKATREELSGSTITVSSLGALGGIAATPIVKPPEVAVVGVNKIVERPVVRDGRVVIRRIMNLSSSFDHRVVDGFDAASFIQAVKAELEAPARLLAAF